MFEYFCRNAVCQNHSKTRQKSQKCEKKIAAKREIPVETFHSVKLPFCNGKFRTSIRNRSSKKVMFFVVAMLVYYLIHYVFKSYVSQTYSQITTLLFTIYDIHHGNPQAPFLGAKKKLCFGIETFIFHGFGVQGYTYIIYI